MKSQSQLFKAHPQKEEEVDHAKPLKVMYHPKLITSNKEVKANM